MPSFRFLVSVAAAVVAVATLPVAAHAQEATATYLVVFEATWSAATHPVDVPPDPHFSPLVAASHGPDVAFWNEGGIATEGIEAMAELGLALGIQAEMFAAVQAGLAHDAAIGGGATSPGVANAIFEASLAHSRATVVSMVAPSPDWFVGVSGLPLLVNGVWVDEVEWELHPYDAGSDAGPTFLAPDDDVDPHVPITEITAFPFAGTPPLGSLRFVRVDPDRPCANGIDDDGDGTLDYGADPGCDGLDDASERAASLACDDGVDGDGDGRIDTADLGCENASSPTESPECSDGINNDPGQDANVDFDGGVYATGAAVAPRDGHCQTPWQNVERRPRSCGIGFEIAPILLGVARVLRRRRR